MLWEHALILGVLQGLTEFLPVSSSGHLVLGQSILGLKEPELFFDVLLHVGTLAAVLVFYGKDLWRIARGWISSLAGKESGDGSARTGWLLILGSVPAGVAGVFVGGLVEEMFASPRLAACALLVTGSILCLSEPKEGGGRGEAQMTAKDALVIGVFQAFAIVPGISRSGATIAAALIRGVAREQAARFSFLLSVPAILGAFALKLKDIEGPLGEKLLPYAVGALAAAVVGAVALGWLIRLVRGGNLARFRYYCWGAGALSLIYLFTTG
ncbi:MAG: undecaprenyl-diphosphate phosphatase [Nitrospinae bacterium]|nr:undecaprenyl-diphosphate phosphatase [Nitrospinota bacterium]